MGDYQMKFKLKPETRKRNTKRKSFAKKAIAYAMSAVLTIGTCSFVLPQTAIKAKAEEPVKAIQLVTNGVANNIEGAQKSNVYFGTYKQTSDGKGGFNIDPIKWRVLENDNGKLFLFSDMNLDSKSFEESLISELWGSCSLRKWLTVDKDGFINKAFNNNEQSAIKEVTNKYHEILWCPPPVGEEGIRWEYVFSGYSNDKVYLLSTFDLYEYKINDLIGFNTAYAENMNSISDIGNSWWLRSEGSFVDENGSLIKGYTDHKTKRAVRPALNINLESIIFTSAAEGGKISEKEGTGALTPVGDYEGNEWKLTIRDEINNRENLKVELKDAKSNEFVLGSKIDFTYENAFSGPNEYISAMLFESNEKNSNTPLYYGRIVDLPDSSGIVNGSASFTIPENLIPDTEYILKFYSEQYNGDYKTDVASGFSDDLRTIKFTAKEKEPSVENFNVVLPFDSTDSKTITYDGKEKKVEVNPLEEIGMGNVTDIRYYDADNREIEGFPVKAGDYSFKVSVEKGTCFKEAELLSDPSWTFTIEKKTPTTDDFDVNRPENTEYDGVEKNVSVSVKSEISGMGDIRVEIYKDGVLQTKLIETGKYIVKLIVSDGDNYTEKELTDETWNFTIGKATPKAEDFTVTLPEDLKYDGNAKCVTVSTDLTGIGDVAVKYINSNGEESEEIPVEPGKYKVRIYVSAGENYEETVLKSDDWDFEILAPDAEEFEDPDKDLEENPDDSGEEEPGEPEEEEPEEPETPPDYLDELYLKLNIATELGGKQTVYWNVGDSLPYDVLHFLELHEDITLIFDYTYEGVDYSVTLGGKGFEADPKVPWAGPLYLYSVYKGHLISKEN